MVLILILENFFFFANSIEIILFRVFKSNTSNEMKLPSLKDIYHKKQRENKQLPERNLTSSSPNHPPEVTWSALCGVERSCFPPRLGFSAFPGGLAAHLLSSPCGGRATPSICLFPGADSGPNATHEAK